MSKQITLQALKASAQNISILYVEDNAGLREKVSALLGKFFADVVVAENGADGLKLFRHMRPKIVLTDIRMPELDGMEMSRRMKAIDPEVKIIVSTAYDDKEYLLECIEIGVFSYINKPFTIDQMADVLLRAVEALENEGNRDTMSEYMHDILNYQSNLLLLMHGDKALYPNQAFLDFFGVDNLKAFMQRYGDIGGLLEEHKGFLYNQEGVAWLDQASLNPDKLFHVKIRDPKKKSHHFILKLHPIPAKAGHYILSLNDVTELNLLSLFDEKAMAHERDINNKAKLFNLFEVVRQNSAKVKVLNFYKGLTIANDAIVVDISEKSVTLKTNFMQQKAVQVQKKMTITSEAFPMDVECSGISNIDFDGQTVTFSEARFIEQTPSKRKNVRVVPEEEHTVSLFYMERKFFGESRIVDLSVTAVKIELDALPAGMQTGEAVMVDMVLPAAKMPLIINTRAKIFRIDQSRYSYQVVCLMELAPDMVKQLTGYIAKRQMDLIREFKGMQIGK